MECTAVVWNVCLHPKLDRQSVYVRALTSSAAARVQNHHCQCNDDGDDALANVIIYVIINTAATVKLRQRLTSRLPHYNAAPSASVQ